MALIDSFLAPFSLMFLVGIGFLITKNQFVLSFCIIGFCLLIALLILYFFVKDPKLKKIAA
jgi:hypothetical protein